MKRNEVLVQIDLLTNEKIRSEDVVQRINAVSNLLFMVFAMDIIKVILQGLPKEGEDFETNAKAYFPIVHEQLKKLIQTLPTETAKEEVTKVFEKEKKKFLGYKKADYSRFNAEVIEFCRLVMNEYLKQRLISASVNTEVTT